MILLVAWPAAGLAQAPGGFAGSSAGSRDWGPPPAALDALQSPAGAFTASLILPGAGQAALGLKRWAPYGLLEAALWTVHLEAAGDVRALSAAYRDLAWEAARLPTGPSARRDGPWSYYETMSHYMTSGAFDRDDQRSGVQPETDESTYNGAVWALARSLFLPGGVAEPGSDEYARAVAYYRDRAAGPDFLWSWVGRQTDLERFRGLIDSADAEARLRTTALGLVLANHLVAAVDALIVARLRTGGVRLESRVSPSPVPGGLRWTVGLRIPIQD